MLADVLFPQGKPVGASVYSLGDVSVFMRSVGIYVGVMCACLVQQPGDIQDSGMQRSPLLGLG